jgi:predicted phosphoadenosine phosphosulfate sulfurtransferase
MGNKRPLGLNVFEAAKGRIAYIFDSFPKIYLSFSGGKDSSVMLHMVMDEAIRRNRKIGLLFVDLEAQYKITIEHIVECFDLYRDHIDPYWIALPIALRNAVSMYEPKWMCWDPDCRDDWVREPPLEAITDEDIFSFFQRNMEFEDFIQLFGEWYSGGQLTACFVGIRSDESLNRYRTLAMNKSRFQGLSWTTYKSSTLYNAYPIYDWRTRDIWVYNGKFKKSYNRLYDLMSQAGLSIHEQRICQPYGDDQRKGLWLYHVIEPETWGRVVARVNGANSGALYAQESGNILGRLKITKPDGHTWESFAKLIMETLPPRSKEHFENKILVFLKWWSDRGYPNGIPDCADTKLEADRKVPSWRRICKALLRNDYWCKGLSFSQTKSESYKKYLKIMKRRKQVWGINW